MSVDALAVLLTCMVHIHTFAALAAVLYAFNYVQEVSSDANLPGKTPISVDLLPKGIKHIKT